MLFKLELNTNHSHKAIGTLLRYYRVGYGYSLRELGAITNVSHTLIANIEQGKVHGSSETLKEIFSTLKISFNDVSDVFDEFKELYELAFNCLYKYEYTRAEVVMQKLMKKENIYIYSVLITDYALLKYFYLVLLGRPVKEKRTGLHNFRKMRSNFSDKQNQLFYLIEGINHYNEGMYAAAIVKLKEALSIGDSKLDYLVNVFLVKCYVKTFNFMDVVQIGNDSIGFFENQVLYLRAMEIRLSIAHSYILAKKYEKAKRLLNSVYEFSNSFEASYLIEEVKLLKGILFFYQGNLEEANENLISIKRKIPIVFFIGIHIAYKEKDYVKAKRIYDDFKNNFNGNSLRKETLIIEFTQKIIMDPRENDEEILEPLEEIIKICSDACDMETLEISFTYLIQYYQKRRMYKKALEVSEKARNIHRYGCLKHKLS